MHVSVLAHPPLVFQQVQIEHFVFGTYKNNFNRELWSAPVVLIAVISLSQIVKWQVVIVMVVSGYGPLGITS